MYSKYLIQPSVGNPHHQVVYKLLVYPTLGSPSTFYVWKASNKCPFMHSQSGWYSVHYEQVVYVVNTEVIVDQASTVSPMNR